MLSPITLQKIDSGRICASICDERGRSSSGKSCPIAGLGEREERRGGWKRSGEASTWEEESLHIEAGTSTSGTWPGGGKGEHMQREAGPDRETSRREQQKEMRGWKTALRETDMY